jgi:uncharacterized membrane-anchored protein YhcB (DUF1043 family)
MFWIGFGIGLVVGATIGFFAAAIMAAGRDKKD